MPTRNKFRTSIFNLSVRHLALITFALLAILPSLALLRMGVLLFLRETLAPVQGLEMTALGIFTLLCFGTGFYCLNAIVTRIKTLHRQSFRLGLENDFGQIPKNLSSDEIHLRQAGSSLSETAAGNEFESLATTLNTIQSHLSHNLGKLQDQAFFLHRLEELLDDSEDIAIITDAENKVLFSNRAARRLLGIEPDSPIRYALQEGELFSEDLKRSIDILESWGNRTEELRFRSDNDKVLTFEVKFRITDGQYGEPSKTVVMRDISASKKLERQLYRSEKLATLGQLISGVAHELNNPLAAILGFAELCRDSHDSREELDRNLEIIEREARRTGHIVENLLNFSRQRQQQRTAVDIHELLERCFNLLSYNFRTTGIVIRRDYDATLPHLTLDEYQIQQVFMNLIVNSAQAMKNANTDSSKITVGTHLTRDEKQVVIEVADNGPGIDPDCRKQIFDPFFTTKQEDEGTGLGLPVSMGIIRNHGGTITLSHPRGQNNTCFKIILPAPVQKKTSKSAKQRSSTIRRDLSGRILAVDDEPSLLKMTAAALHKNGLEVITAASVKEALTQLVTYDFDMALVDMYLPDGTGMDIWEFIQNHQPQLAGKVVFMTGEPRVRRKLETRLGIDPPLLLKPFHVNKLYDTVKEHLGEQRETLPEAAS